MWPNPFWSMFWFMFVDSLLDLGFRPFVHSVFLFGDSLSLTCITDFLCEHLLFEIRNPSFAQCGQTQFWSCILIYVCLLSVTLIWGSGSLAVLCFLLGGLLSLKWMTRYDFLCEHLLFELRNPFLACCGHTHF